MSFDLQSVPFSTYGSYLAVSHMQARDGQPSGLYLRSCHKQSGTTRCLRLALVVDGAEVEFTSAAEPDCLHLQCPAGWVDLVFDDARTLRARGEGVSLRLGQDQCASGDAALPRRAEQWQVRLFSRNFNAMLIPLHGQLEVEAPWQMDHSTSIRIEARPDPGSEKFEIAIEEFDCEWQRRQYTRTFEQCRKAAAEAYQLFLRNLPRTPRSLNAARELAGYILWSAAVGPHGHFQRDTVLMSKNHMAGVWSWDNCFNAMALAGQNPELAWDQIMTVFDHQDPMGALPDAIGEGHLVRAFVKPPIYGWTLKWISRNTSMLTPERVAEIYPRLCALTEWWFANRDDDRDGICQYNHGNDSGWDNATIFAAGCPIESPDLMAWLIAQMDFLADAAGMLGKTDQADAWRKRSDRQLTQMIEKLWQVDQFVATVPESQWVQPEDTGDSLILYMPILLGERLSDEIREKMIASLRQSGRFFTKFGYATESPKSPLYEADGYWRGPIWAPPTMILADGLARSGQEGLAHEIARRFCRMCAQSGFAENFDAQTGQPLRDKAYTWTASVFLVLASQFLLSDR
ncbi:MAG: amylo-alpha-1,6-glucosidase [Phycisphaerae bacterium]